MPDDIRSVGVQEQRADCHDLEFLIEMPDSARHTDTARQIAGQEAVRRIGVGSPEREAALIERIRMEPLTGDPIRALIHTRGRTWMRAFVRVLIPRV